MTLFNKFFKIFLKNSVQTSAQQQAKEQISSNPKKEVHFLLPETAEEYKKLLQQEEERIECQQPAVVDEKQMEEIKKTLLSAEREKIVSQGKIAERSFSFDSAMYKEDKKYERRLVLFNDKFFLIKLIYQSIRESRIKKCPECGYDMVSGSAHGMGGGCSYTACPKCNPGIYQDKTWNNQIHGPATYSVTVGYEGQYTVGWGTDSLQQFSDGELHVVSEYRKSGKLPENKEIQDVSWLLNSPIQPSNEAFKVASK